jgi:hypothetical protein
LFHTDPKQGLFSENHEILPTSAGKDLYAGLVVLFSALTYGLAGLLLSDELLKVLGIHWKWNRGGATGTGAIMDAGSLESNNLEDSAEGSQEIGGYNSNGAGEFRKRFASQGLNGRGAGGGERYQNEDVERQ